jgi:hypothetical protein
MSWTRYLPPYREFSVAESGHISANSDSSKSRREPLYLDLHDEQQILERITSQDWPGLAMIPTLDMGRGVMATRFFRSGSVVCDYHGPVLKRDQAESLRRSMAAAESNYMYFFKYDSQRLCIDAATVPCVCHPRIPTVWADGEPFRGPSEPTHGL